jgi:acetoin utilization protein AcuC
MPDQPLLVFGPRSLDYDFGPAHPLTPRRFGPGMDLLTAIGAGPGLAPEPATDAELLACHAKGYVDVVRHFSLAADHGGWLEPEAGISIGGDDPPFAGMHEAAAAVAGGSLRAMEAILRGDVEHAFHPGGGLHHAMPDRAAGFCIYNDPALAIAAARRSGLRVLYVDLDVHHGDGVEAIHAADPGVLTLSFHETTRTLFPYVGGGFDHLGAGDAAGTVVNVPLQPGTGQTGWLTAVETLVPELAATFAPDIIVSQHGADSHAWDPLAHLANTTTAMGAAARLVDRVAHQVCGGRWLSTGGGGYGVYDVVPRSWSLVWLAAAHREVPTNLPAGWRDRWAVEAARYGVATLPEGFEDPPAGLGASRGQAEIDAASAATARLVREAVVPRVLRHASERGWWRPLEGAPRNAGAAVQPGPAGDGPRAEVAITGHADRAAWRRLTEQSEIGRGAFSLGSRGAVADLLDRAIGDGAVVTHGVTGGGVVGLAVSDRPEPGGPVELLWLGVASEVRRATLGGRLLRAHLGSLSRAFPGAPVHAVIAVGDRDPVEPLDARTRTAIVRRLLEREGFGIREATGLARIDPTAIEAELAAVPRDDDDGG